jgi:hypothetical protein
LILRPKSRNRRDDFEAQITKLKLPVLSPKPENPPPPWFSGSTKKSTADFEAKLGETVVTSFEAKLEKTVATGFAAKPEKIVVTDFDAKPEKTVVEDFDAKPPETVTTGFDTKLAKTARVILRPNHSQIVTISFEAQTDEKPSEWF